MTLRDTVEKITRKSKGILLDASRAYNSQGRAIVPYEELIVESELYPEQYFLVHKNMIFEGGTIKDSSFDVYSFDIEGDFIQKEDFTDKKFYRTMQVIKKI